MSYKRLDDDVSLSKYYGIFRPQVGLFQAVALIISGTIGAGILGLPYVVSKVGLRLGVLYIIFLGFVMMGLNLLVGEVVARTKGEFQLVGLSKKYLGKFGGYIMTAINYLMSFGVLVVYIIGEGETLSTLLGGSNIFWSLVFFVLASILVIIGIRTIKVLDLFLSLGILTVIIIIAVLSGPHIQFPNIIYHNPLYFLLPYGVILFAFSSAGAIPEAHSILKNRDVDFKKAIIIASLIAITAYSVFAIAVVGVTGIETTEIATIGLGDKVSHSLYIFGNLFAFLAMGTSFLMVGLSLSDSLNWDYKISKCISKLLVLGIPLAIFLVGLRGFIEVIDIVGGVFVSLEMMFLVLVYWRAKSVGHLGQSKFKLHHSYLLLVLLFIVLTIGGIYSVFKLF